MCFLSFLFIPCVFFVVPILIVAKSDLVYHFSYLYTNTGSWGVCPPKIGRCDTVTGTNKPFLSISKSHPSPHDTISNSIRHVQAKEHLDLVKPDALKGQCVVNSG